MSLEERPVRRIDAVGDVRAGARRQARSWSGASVALAAMAIALIVMAAIIVLDYLFVQETHRVVKVAMGLGVIGAILAFPRVGLLLLPIVTPFLPWIPPAPIPGLNPLNAILFAIFGTYALGKALAREPILRPSRLGGALALLLALCVLSIVRGAAFPVGVMYDARDAGLQLFRSGTTFASYFIFLAMVRERPERRRLAWAIMLGLLAESLVTLKLGRNGSGARAIGSIGQSNELGAYLALFAVVGLAMVAGTKHWFGKLVLLGTACLASFGVMLSLSRGSMIALVAGCLLVAWRSSKILLFALVAVLLISPIWLPDYVKDRITSSRVQVEGSDEATIDKASEARIETWRSIMSVVEDHPLDGVGFSGLGYVLPDIGNELGLADVKDSAHNTFMRMLGELGVFGLLAFVWLLWKTLAMADEGVRRARDPFDRALAVGMWGATVAMAISCAFGDRFFNVVLTGGFWALAGLVNGALLEAGPPRGADKPARPHPARPRRAFT